MILPTNLTHRPPTEYIVYLQLILQAKANGPSELSDGSADIR